jgi:hypothetical protein
LLGVKAVGHEAGNSSPTTAEVKNVWSHTPASHTFSWHGA